ncbi:MAG: urease accessory protein UreD, partial [Acidobacteria bacterium]
SMPFVEADRSLPVQTNRADLPPRAVDPGTGRLEFAWTRSRTVLRRSFATSPLKILSPRRNQGRLRSPASAGQAAAWAYLASYGGGLVGGDAIHVTLDVQPRARAVVLTQSSTKVYRSGLPASQCLTGQVDDEALLVVAPDPTVCFAGSTFRQVHCYKVTMGGSLVLLDWMTCGRLAMGERWAFDGYASRLELWRAQRRVLYDATVLRPDDGPIAERMGRFNIWGTLVMVGPLVREMAAEIVVRTGELPVEPSRDVIISASRLTPDGALLRVAGESVEKIRTILRTHMGFLRPLLGDEVWDRKW